MTKEKQEKEVWCMLYVKQTTQSQVTRRQKINKVQTKEIENHFENIGM